MAGNTIGQLFRLTTFGESHGSALGGIIDGCPAGIIIDEHVVSTEMNRRRPGVTGSSSARRETDQVEFLSGIFEGKTTGTPIAFLIKNHDVKSEDYDALKDVFRPSHADYTYFQKYGVRDHRGGGRASARETAARVAAGAVAKIFLAQQGIHIHAFTSQIGNVRCSIPYQQVKPDEIYKDDVRCPEKSVSNEMQQLLHQLKQEGDSTGGMVTCFIQGCPIGLGEPVFDKLQADIAKAMMSIPAAKGFEYGEGFSSMAMKGSEHNDMLKKKDGKVGFSSNHAGGILGGISNGEDIYFNVGFKPIASIAKKQPTIDATGKQIELEVKGRHDVCAVPRAVPVVEAMAALVVADHFIRLKTIQ